MVHGRQSNDSGTGHVDLFLKLFDEELQKVGATRGSVLFGGDVSELKSVAKLIGSPESLKLMMLGPPHMCVPRAGLM